MRDWLINLPEELTESDLVDMVEGTLPAEREGVAITALKQEPRLGLLIKQMRQDRAALAGLQAAAPAGVIERVLDELDQAALRELDAEAQQHAAGVPTPSLTTKKPSALEIVFQSMWTRRMAAAAALVLAAGMGMYGVRVMLDAQQQRELRKGGIALNNPKASSLPDVTLHNPNPGEAPGQPPAVGTPETTPAQLASADQPTTPAMPAPEQPVPPSDALAHQASLISPAMAVALAREGRLTIRVGGLSGHGSTSEIVGRLESLARGNGRSAINEDGVAMVVHGGAINQVPVQYAMLLTPSAEPSVSGPVSKPGLVEPPAVASSGDGKEPAPVTQTPIQTPSPALPRVRRVVKAVYFVEVEPTEQSMRALLKLVEQAGKKPASAGPAVFKALDRGVSQPTAFDAESVLWWAGPSSRWVKPAVVPIVIEGVE